MAAKLIIVKNTTGSGIDVAGEYIAASDQTIIDISRLNTWRTDPDVETLINAGDLVVNDGTNDLSAPLGLAFIHSDSSPHTLYVSPTGNDTYGDGGSSNPYRTIKHTLSEISSSGSTNRFMVIVAPGVYVEDNPLSVPTYVELFSLGSTSASLIQAANPGSNLIEVAGITSIKGFTLFSSDGNSLIYQNDASGFCSIADVTFSTCDHGISCLAGIISAYNLKVAANATIEHVIHLEAGAILTVDGFALVSDTITADAAFHSDGGDLSVSSFLVNSTSVTDGLLSENSGIVRLGNGLFIGVDNAIHANTSSNISMNAVSIIDTGTNDFLVDDSTVTFAITACEFNREKLSIPSELTTINAFYLNNEPDVSGLRVLGNVVGGRPEVGTEFAMGRGDAFTRGMIVLTTDDTATSTTDGGNITDVTDEATSYTASTFSFQGVEANHTILFGCDIDEDSDKLKFYSIHMKQTIAAVEITKKSFVFELWNGTAWEEFGVMATYQPLSYVYSKEIFIRSNQTEVINFGFDDTHTWAKKTIDGHNVYWVRVRIIDDLTTAPVFEQSKLGTSNCMVNQIGVVRLNGLARYRKTILATGNVFGESGGITYSNPLIGNTGAWDHSMKNNKFNEIGDALYLQFALPRGVDTSFPLDIVVYYQDTNGTASSDGTLRISALPMEVVGVLTADETGGSIPVARTLGDVSTTTADDAQIIDSTISLGNADIILTSSGNKVDISDAYAGDMVAVKIEYLDDGDADKDLIIWGVEISAVNWVLGDRV